MNDATIRAAMAILKDINKEERERESHMRKAKEHETRGHRLIDAAIQAIKNDDRELARTAVNDAKKQSQEAKDEKDKAGKIHEQIIGKCKALSILLATE